MVAFRWVALILFFEATAVLGGGGGGSPPPPPPPCGWDNWGSWGYASTCVLTRLQYCSTPGGCSGGCQGQVNQGYQSISNAGSWTGWGQWESWSTTCGAGSRRQTRSCTPASSCNAGCAGASENFEYSNTIGAYSQWTSWSPWSTTCAVGSRSRSCQQFCGSTASCPGSATDSRTICCSSTPAYWSSWSFGGWSTTCGSGSRTVSRSCIVPTYACSTTCPGSPSYTDTNCCINAVNGVWNPWSGWSATCLTQTGTNTRSRTCTAACGGSDCPGSNSDSRTIDTGGTCCKVDATWSTWSVWSTWSTTCGDGTIRRTRTCSFPAGLDSRCQGNTCAGDSVETNSRTAFLAVNGGWTTWTDWDITCGNRQRTRTCSNPTTSCGGVFCSGSSLDSSFLCCPVAASWSGWTAWSPWSGACAGPQTRSHTRTCSTPCGSPVCTGVSTASSTKPLSENCCVGTYGRTLDNTCQPCSTCAAGLSVISPCTTVQNIICGDTTPPVITILGANPQTTQAGQPWIDPGADANDVISGRLAVVVTPTGGVNVRQLGSQTITYTATDFAGNSASATRVVNVVDTLPPVLTLNSNAVITWEANTTYVDPGCLAVDQLDGTVAVTTTGLPINTNLIRNYTISYRACDARALCATLNRTVIIVQTTVPVITLLGLSTITVEAPALFVDPGATAYDTVDGTLTSLITRTFQFLNGSVFVAATGVDQQRLGTYRISYNLVNARGLRALTMVRTVNLVDTTPPNITLFGANPFLLQGATPYIEPGFSSMDAFYGNVTSLVVVTGNLFSVMAAPNTTFTISYSVTDPSGNNRVVTRTVIIIDTIPPRLFLLGNATFFQQANTTYVDPGVFANDTLDGILTPNVTVTGTVRVNSPFLTNFVLQYNVVDRAGNRATPVSRTVIIINTIPPVITLRGGDMTWEAAVNPFVDPGATAWDVIDGDISALINRTGSVNVMSPSNTAYTLSYRVRDTSGLEAIVRYRTVTIIDTTRPVIILRGNATFFQQGAFPYVDPGATAFDTLNGNITNSIVTVNPVNTSAPAGTVFVVTYNVLDAAGNAAIQVNRTVIIIDTIPPVLTLLGSPTVNWQGAVPWVDPGCRANDLLSGDITSLIQINGTVNVMAPAGTVFTLTYLVTDPAGNRAVPVTRTVVIIDTIAPAIELRGADSMTYESAQEWVDPGYVAFDTLDGNITSRVNITGHINVMAPSGSFFELLYNVRDRAGNQAPQRQRNVTMLDTIPPVITLHGLQVVHHQGATEWVDPGFTAWDALDGNLTVNVTVDGDVVNVMAFAGTTFNIRYSVRDVAGNFYQIVRTVIIIDTIAPIIYLNGLSFLTQECTFPYVDAGATANDTLDGNLTVNITLTGEVNVWAPSQTSFNLTYSVVDRAGNRAINVIRVVLMLDTIPPNVTLLGEPFVFAEGGAAYLDVGAVSHDLLDGDLTSWIFENVTLSVDPTGLTSPLAPSVLATEGNMSIITTFAPLSSNYTIDFISIDRAGNIGRVQRLVTIVSTLPPLLLLLGQQSVRVREGTLYLDAGAVASSQYFGDLTSEIDTRSLSGLALSELSTQVGAHLLEYSVADPSGMSATPRYRTVNVLAASPIPVLTPSSGATETGASTGASTSGGSSTPVDTRFVSYSTVSLNFDMSVTTPDLQFTPSAYKICFIPYPRVTNIVQMLANASIFPTYLKCTSDIFRMCVLEAPLVTTADIDKLRSLNTTVSVSWTPLPLLNYAGAFNTTPPLTPPLTDAAVLLQQKGISTTTDLTCADTDCSFFTNARPTREIHLQRRAVARTDIGSWFLQANPAPLMKRAIRVSVDPAKLNITEDQVLAAINLLGLQPNDISCLNNVCVLQTYDPLQPRHLTQLQQALPIGSTVSDISYFVDTEVTFANPSPTNSTNPVSAIFEAVSVGIAPHTATCTASSCTLRTHAVVSVTDILHLNARVGSVSVNRVNQSTTSPVILLGYYSTVVTISSKQSIYAALATANVTDFSNMSCFASLLVDEAEECSFITPDPLTSDQLFALRDFEGVSVVTPSREVTFQELFRLALRRVLASESGLSPDRILITSIDPVTGRITLDILSSAFGSNSNSTLYTGNFTVNMSSISLNTARVLLARAGIVPVDLSVEGSTVTYTAINITQDMLAALRNQTQVLAASNPVVAQPVLTHEEAAQLILDLVDNNDLTVSIGGRTYWAVPKSGSSTTDHSSPSSSSALSSSSMIGIIAAGAALLLAVVVIGLLYRRHKARKSLEQSQNESRIFAAAFSSRSDRSLVRDRSVGVQNPLYQDDFVPTYGEQHYDDVQFVGDQGAYGAASESLYASNYAVPQDAFSNPMYDVSNTGAAAPPGEVVYASAGGLLSVPYDSASEPSHYFPVYTSTATQPGNTLGRPAYSGLFGNAEPAKKGTLSYDRIKHYAVPFDGDDGYMQIISEPAPAAAAAAADPGSEYLQIQEVDGFGFSALHEHNGQLYDIPMDKSSTQDHQAGSSFAIPSEDGAVYNIPMDKGSTQDHLAGQSFAVPAEDGQVYHLSTATEGDYGMPNVLFNDFGTVSVNDNLYGVSAPFGIPGEVLPPE